jgi:putative membrane protein
MPVAFAPNSAGHGHANPFTPIKENNMKTLLAGLFAAACMSQAAYSAQSLTPADFVAKASEAGMAEIEFGKLAGQKASAADVKAYGRRMVADHGKADAELKPLAEAKKLPTAKALNAQHQKALESLQQKSGGDFDAAFAKQMVADHNEAVALFSSAEKLPDAELAAFATKTLPTLREHQAEAGKLHTH